IWSGAEAGERWGESAPIPLTFVAALDTADADATETVDDMSASGVSCVTGILCGFPIITAVRRFRLPPAPVPCYLNVRKLPILDPSAVSTLASAPALSQLGISRT
ncbi:hypothetical protein, partial [Leifsonia sp. NCR5]|uniref:hypothetical protein n=1 Tax=Leifsonia sp. NCR5 TaxID=1978342 RepID=UPI0015C410CD